MNKSRITVIFLSLLGIWVLASVVIAFATDRFVVLTTLPLAAILVAAARAEKLSQTAQLAWPVLMLPGATFVFIGFMQSMGYGQMDNEPHATFMIVRAVFFGSGLLLHLAAFALLASEPRASDHPGGEIARGMP